MITIHEQGKGKGIGHSLDSFYTRFIQICEESKKNNIRKIFAFLLYDYNDTNIKKLLKDKGAFVRLDRLTGKNLDVFYLDHSDKNVFKSFNEIFLIPFDIQEKIKFPVIIFFDVFSSEVENINFVEFDQSNFTTVFNDIYKIFEEKTSSEAEFYTKKPKFTKGVKILSNIGEKIFLSFITDKIKKFLYE